MRFQINWICLALLLSTPVFAVARVKPKLQGEWSRAGHPTRFKVSGNKFIEYKANNPNSPDESSAIRYPFGKSYAEVTFKNGDRRKIYSAGENMVAVESFDKKGAFIGDGTIFHRHGMGEWSDPQTPIGRWKIGKESWEYFNLFPDGTGKADYHNEDILWNQDADGYVRAITAKGHRKITTYELSDDGSRMTVVACNWNEKAIGNVITRVP